MRYSANEFKNPNIYGLWKLFILLDNSNEWFTSDSANRSFYYSPGQITRATFELEQYKGRILWKMTIQFYITIQVSHALPFVLHWLEQQCCILADISTIKKNGDSIRLDRFSEKNLFTWEFGVNDVMSKRSPYNWAKLKKVYF